MTIETVNPLAIKQGAKAGKIKGAYGTSYGGAMPSYGASSPSGFDAMLDAVGAMEGVSATTAAMYGDVNSSTVLAAAFSGVGAYGAQSGGGGVPYMASGGMNSLQTGGSLLPSSGTPVVPGTEGYSHSDMINSMNQNNLELLELQATMQSNMQSWNTKSNILSADHRARMAMIEKFTARG